MSEQPQVNSYNNFDVNAIKNTKLFKKFMQNKSGLITNKQERLQNKSEISKKQNNFEIVNVPQIKNNELKRTKTLQVEKTNKYAEYHQHIIQKNYQNQQSNSFQVKTQHASNNNCPQYQQKDYSKVQSYQRGIISNIIMNPYQNYQSYQQQYTQKQKVTNNNQETQTSKNRRKRNFDTKNFQPNCQPQYKNFNHQRQSLPRSQNLGKWNKQANLNNILQINDQTQNYKINSTQNYKNESTQHYINKQPQNYKNEQSHKHKNEQTKNNKNDNQIKASSIQTKNISPLRPLVLKNQSIQQSELSFKSKYQKLLIKYQQCRSQMKSQTKSYKRQQTQWQCQIQLLKQKLFSVQSRQDSLRIQNQRYKQKYQTQLLNKTKSMQDAKQLQYKLQQYQDMLLMKDQTIKKRTDQSNYWKQQAEQVRNDSYQIKMILENKNNQYHMLYNDYHVINNQNHNKEGLLDELRKNNKTLVEEKCALNDQLFKILTKLFHFEQQNIALKADLKRQSDSSTLSYMRDRIQSTNLQKNQRSFEKQDFIRADRTYERPQLMRPQKTYERPEILRQKQAFIQKNNINNVDLPLVQKTTRRRGQFARQRGQVTRVQKPQNDRSDVLNQNTKYQSPKINKSSFPNRSNRMQQISDQLDKIKDMKAMNGAIRRRKIQLQRELQELQTK